MAIRVRRFLRHRWQLLGLLALTGCGGVSQAQHNLRSAAWGLKMFASEDNIRALGDDLRVLAELIDDHGDRASEFCGAASRVLDNVERVRQAGVKIDPTLDAIVKGAWATCQALVARP